MPRIKLKVLTTASVTSGIVPVLFLNQVQLVPFLLLFHRRPFLHICMRPLFHSLLQCQVLRDYLITSPETRSHPISTTVILTLRHLFLGIYRALELCCLFIYLGSINIEMKEYQSLRIPPAVYHLEQQNQIEM